MGAGGFSTNYRESSLISKLESSRQSAWSRQLALLSDFGEELSRRMAMKLVDAGLIEVKNIRELEEQLAHCIAELQQAEDFDIQYAISPIRDLVPRPNRASLYITAFIIEKLLEHRTVVDIYGTDEDIYEKVNEEVNKLSR